MLAVAMPDRPRHSTPLSAKVAARNRLWLRLLDELKLTATQIARHFAKPVRTVQRGIKWARLNPLKATEAEDAKATTDTLKYVSLRYGESTDPAVKEWLASLAPRRRSN